MMVTIDALLRGEDKIAVVGLGYVGLPLAVCLAEHFEVVGYDRKSERISELNAGKDRTLEVTEEELKRFQLTFTDNPGDLAQCRFIIVAVPTPIDEYRNPDLRPLESSSKTVGMHIQKGSCVVYESTVYPGATEDVCIPIIEENSGLKFGVDFTAGYSPERINPGDKSHSIAGIVKIISGYDAHALELLEGVYGKIIKAGLFKASSIKVAEAAKVIENTQRDLNIALMNELAMIFDKIGIDTTEVLKAAGTKWNFMPFSPGLVGGHCIGVDPYYLTFKAEALGYHPEMILAGRRINDNMGKFVAEKTVKMMIRADKKVNGGKVAVLGVTFKENVPDLRNTKVVDIINELRDYGINVLAEDPLADKQEAMEYYGLELTDMECVSDVDAVVVAVMHEKYKTMGLDGLTALFSGKKPLIIDIKGMFEYQEADSQEISYWRL